MARSTTTAVAVWSSCSMPVAVPKSSLEQGNCPRTLATNHHQEPKQSSLECVLLHPPARQVDPPTRLTLIPAVRKMSLRQRIHDQKITRTERDRLLALWRNRLTNPDCGDELLIAAASKQRFYAMGHVIHPWCTSLLSLPQAISRCHNRVTVGARLSATDPPAMTSIALMFLHQRRPLCHLNLNKCIPYVAVGSAPMLRVP